MFVTGIHSSVVRDQSNIVLHLIQFLFSGVRLHFMYGHAIGLFRTGYFEAEYVN